MSTIDAVQKTSARADHSITFYNCEGYWFIHDNQEENIIKAIPDYKNKYRYVYIQKNGLQYHDYGEWNFETCNCNLLYFPDL